MTLAAPRPLHPASTAQVRFVTTSVGVPPLALTAAAPSTSEPSPVFRGIFFAGLLSLPFWVGVAVVIGLVAR